MATLRFGTDGVRGRAFDELSPGFCRALGRVAAEVLAGRAAVIARDTRESGPRLLEAFASGLAEGGVRPLDLGVAPTPAVAHVAAARGAMGAMISASHNPWYDNGIKLFTSTGAKLDNGQQQAIESRLEEWQSRVQPGEPGGPGGPGGEAAGGAGSTIESIQSDLGDWLGSVAAVASHGFGGLRVVVDAANGAASHVVGPLLADLGAEVDLIGADPDGRNINDGCGSTHPETVRAAVLERGADLGLALDGDADRLLSVDHTGRIVDGDHLMAILATDLRDRGRLRDDTVAVTIMTNLGFHKAMAARGIAVHVTPVGDRHILEALTSNRWNFGGEQSGHLIFLDDAPTGDGCLSAVHLLDVLARTGRPLAELADVAMTSFPQVLHNVRVATRADDPAAALADEIAAAEAELGDTGRVLVRASGTEPVVRVMVEAATESGASRVCEGLVAAVVARFGTSESPSRR